MNSDDRAAVQLAEELCSVLERLETALVKLDAETLLGTEVALSRVVDALASITEAPGHERQALDPLIRRARALLLNCRRLGGSFAAVARVRLPLCTGGHTYDRGG